MQISIYSEPMILTNPILLAFIGSLFFFVLIGALSILKSNQSTSDYLVANQSVNPWLVSLSAVASMNSGYMFVGMIGYTYLVGLSSIWLAFGWIVGDFVLSFWVHSRFCPEAQSSGSLSYSELLGKWGGRQFNKVRLLSAVLTVLFLSVYAAAQLKAGGKAMHAIFGWDLTFSAVLGTVIVILYCFAGGIRASIWTDAAQSFVMIVAMGILFFTGISAQGGVANTITQLSAVSDTYLSLIPSETRHLGPLIAVLLFAASWLCGGIAVIGQPHIMVRFISLNNANQMTRIRWYYYSWYVVFFVLTIGVGLLARLYLGEHSFDAELALPKMSISLLPELLVGVVLAGIFAAAMSTADSQILSCTAAITRDFQPSKTFSLKQTKIVTILIAIFSLIIAISAPANVFNLVLVAWSGLGSAFAPLLTIYALNKRISERTALVMMIIGFLVSIIWRTLGYSDLIYEALPGILSGFIVYFISTQFKEEGSK